MRFRSFKAYKKIADVYQSYDVGSAILELLKEIRRLRKVIRDQVGSDA